MISGGNVVFGRWNFSRLAEQCSEIEIYMLIGRSGGGVVAEQTWQIVILSDLADFSNYQPSE